MGVFLHDSANTAELVRCAIQIGLYRRGLMDELGGPKTARCLEPAGVEAGIDE